MGNKAVTNATGAHHIQTRKILAPALTPKATQQFIPRILEVAEELCTEWAETRQLKGEDAMKAFTFQVALPCPALTCPALPCPACFVMLCIAVSATTA